MKQKNYKNHIIQKKWSQVFLKDQNVINTIINIFNPKKYQTIIEIGPGLGALTKPILDIVDFLILIECDTLLSNRLVQAFPNKKITIFTQDVLTTNFFNLLTQPQQKLRLIGNLPYNIATKLIIYLFKYINIIYDMHFMIQEEVGNRIVAQPNSKEYGRLSIIAQYYCKVHQILKISKKSFIPTPKIESVMIKFTPYHITTTPYPHINIQLLSLITQLAFHQRRKMIRNSLSKLFDTTEMLQNNININLRAENLTIHQFCTLVKILDRKIQTMLLFYILILQ